MLFILICCIYSFDHPIKNILIGNWSIKAVETIYDDNIEVNHKYHLQFQEYESFSAIGDLIEHFNNSQTELITTVKLDFADLITIVWTGSLNYFYKLIKIQFIKSRNNTFFSQGKFIDGTGSYVCSLYSPTRIDFTLYEKDKVTSFSMEKDIHNVPFLWMSKYFYFLPVTIFLIIISFLPCESDQTKKSIKVKAD